MLGRLALFYRADLYRLALRMCASKAEADDVVQETLEGLLGREEQLESIENAQGFLVTSLVNRCRDRWRRAAVRRRHETTDTPLLDVPMPDPDPPSIEEQFPPERLREAFLRLEPTSRRAFEMFEMQHLAYRDIAEELEIPMGTVGTLLFRARRRLREMLTAGGTSGGGAR